MDMPAVEIATYNLHTKKNNLIYALRVATKRVLDRAAVETLDEAQPEVRMLCAVLEHVVSFRMKLQVGWFGAEEKLSFWQFLTAALRKNSQYMARLRAVEAIETLRTELAKERAFLRIALIDKSFAELVAYVSTRRDAIRNFYNDGSFFSESTRANRVLLEAAKRLAMHDFSFDVRQQTLNAPFTIEIDFCALSASPRPSTSHEETAMVAKESASGESSGCEEATLETVESNAEDGRFGKLESRLRTAVEQNAYLESVLREQRTQIERLTAARAESDRQTAALRSTHASELRTYEQTILELQVQLTLVREQHERELLQLREVYENVPSTEADGRFPAVELRTLSRSTDSSASKQRDAPRLVDNVPYVEVARVPPNQLVIPSNRTFTATDESLTPTAVQVAGSDSAEQPRSTLLSNESSRKFAGNETPNSVASTSSFEVVNGVVTPNVAVEPTNDSDSTQDLSSTLTQ